MTKSKVKESETGKDNPDRPNTLSKSSGAKSPKLSRNRAKHR